MKYLQLKFAVLREKLNFQTYYIAANVLVINNYAEIILATMKISRENLCKKDF